MLNANMEVSKSRKMRTFNNIRFMEVLSMIRYMGMPCLPLHVIYISFINVWQHAETYLNILYFWLWASIQTIFVIANMLYGKAYLV